MRHIEALVVQIGPWMDVADGMNDVETCEVRVHVTFGVCKINFDFLILW